MRQTIALFLTLFMVTALAACGSAPEAGQTPASGSAGAGSSSDAVSSTPETEEKVHTFVDGSVFSAVIAVGPSFEIFLGSEGTVLAVDYLNESAEATLSGMDVTGKIFSEGLRALIDAIYEKGLISDGASIRMTPYVKDGADVDPAVFIDAYPAVLEEFTTNTGRVISVNMDAINGGTASGTQGSGQQSAGDSQQEAEQEEQVSGENTSAVLPENVTVTIRSDDGRILQAQETDSDGNEITTDYDPSGNVVVVTIKTPAGERIVTETASDGKQVTTNYDAGGRMIRVTETAPDGSKTVTDFEGDGSGSSSGGQSEDHNPGPVPDDSSSGQQDASHGSGTTPDSGSDSGQAEEKPDSGESGKNVPQTAYDADGTRLETTYLEDGRQMVTHYRTDGSVIKVTYSTSGVRQRAEAKMADGWQYDLTFYKSGKTHIDIYISPEGHYTKQIYAEDGRNISFYNVYTDGTVEYRTCNPNGSTATITKDSPDGSHHESTFDENGVLTGTYELWADGTKVYVTYHGNGKRKEDTRHFPDGSSVTLYYDESENLLNEVWS